MDPMGRRILFDAVLFDLDGTLVATDRFWIQAARTGARRAFARLGLTRPLPGAEAWMGLVGHPIEEGFAALFPDLEAGQRDEIARACLEEEHRLLAGGGAAPMPGALETLEVLSRAGVRLGIASNCSGEYLRHMLTHLGLARWVPEARCLDSPGIGSKADMIADLLETFGSRSAVMVGDRAGDRDAAHANGLPHVHCAFGFAPEREVLEAEATIEDVPGLLGVLDGRRRALERLLERLALGHAGGKRPPVLGVGGAPAAGKTLLAADLAQLLRERGLRVTTVPTGAFAASELVRDVLEPHARGEAVALERKACERSGLPFRLTLEVPAGAALVLEGDGLDDPVLRKRLDRLVWLTLGDEEVLRRVEARDARRLGLAPLERMRDEGLPAHRALEAVALAGADLVVDGSNPLDPSPVGSPGRISPP